MKFQNTQAIDAVPDYSHDRITTILVKAGRVKWARQLTARQAAEYSFEKVMYRGMTESSGTPMITDNIL